MFREQNNGKIKSEEIEGENCTKFKLKNNTVQLVRDYCDYEIDGVLLSEYISKKFWEKSKFEFSNYYIGLIGSFGKFWSQIKLLSLLGNETTRENIISDKIVQNYLNNVNKQYHEQVVNGILKELNSNEVSIYGCPICGDEECGSIKVNIKYNNEVEWTINNEDSSLKWKFDRSHYEDEMNNYFDRLKPNVNL